MRNRLHILSSTGAALALVVMSVPALAQSGLDGRVSKLEKEMQAVQRKVFPGGAGAVLQPDLTPAPVDTQTGSPASLPIADLTARVNAIESQLAQLTGQVEQNGYRMRQLEQQFNDFKAAQAAVALPALSTDAPASAPNLSAATPAAPSRPTANAPTQNRPAAAPAGASAARLEAIAAVERPSTGNAALDSYTYGYRLWSAKFYPEAQVQLQEAVDKYGKTDVASRAQNLLGRAYLDDGKPARAANILYENYRLRPKGDRAAESLAWTAEALIQLKRNSDACLAYAELNDVFGASMQANLRGMMVKGRERAKCGA